MANEPGHWYWLRRLPRLVYWVAGAVVSFGGAVGARFLAQASPPAERVPIWLMGGVFIFIGLSILSLGTRARLEDEALFAEDENGQGANGNNRQPGKSDPPQPAGPPA